MKYFSIDIETTGVDSDNHQILEIGAIFEDTEKQLSFEEIPKFHCFVKHNEIRGVAFALNMNARILEILAHPSKHKDENIIRNEDASFELGVWVRNCLQTREGEIPEIICAGKNFASFDKQFLENLPHWKHYIKIKSRSIDPAILYTDFKNDTDVANTKDCMERAELKYENEHYAIYDAWNIIQLLRKKY